MGRIPPFSLQRVHHVPTGPNFQATNLPHTSIIVPCKNRPIAVSPPSPHSQNPTTGFDKRAFVLALYIHGKNFCKIDEFIASDNIVPSLQRYYYDQFKSTPPHTTWRHWKKQFQITGENVFVDNLLDIIKCQSFFTKTEQDVIYSQKRKFGLAKLVVAWKDAFGLKRLLETLDTDILREATKVKSLKDVYRHARRVESGERNICDAPIEKSQVGEDQDAPVIQKLASRYAKASRQENSEEKMRDAITIAADKRVASGDVHQTVDTDILREATKVRSLKDVYKYARRVESEICDASIEKFQVGEDQDARASRGENRRQSSRRQS